VPILLLTIGAGLYSLDDLIFWRALTYLAVFHFVRQQYGFMMIYARNEAESKWLDKAAIYGATIVPLIYWHSHKRDFNWFIEGDFFHLTLPYISEIAIFAYGIILVFYGVREWRRGYFNVPKNLLLLGTILSWGVGIMAFNNDIIFTATNVLAHGIPYLALTWLYGRNQRAFQGERTSFVFPFFARLFTPQMIVVYLLALWALAFLEEGLWDGLIWSDHKALFMGFDNLPLVENRDILVWLVPLLALPQATHYVLDAFIWRTDGNVADFKRILFLSSPSNDKPF
jgi:hypothetical protein